jgi:hypothetical protein
MSKLRQSGDALGHRNVWVCDGSEEGVEPDELLRDASEVLRRADSQSTHRCNMVHQMSLWVASAYALDGPVQCSYVPFWDGVQDVLVVLDHSGCCQSLELYPRSSGSAGLSFLLVRVPEDREGMWVNGLTRVRERPRHIV